MNDEHDVSLEDLVTRARVTHHVATRALLRSIHDTLEGLAEGCAPADFEHVEALRRSFAYFRDDLLAHLVGEERVVFPYVIALEQAVTGRAPPPRAGFRTIASPIRVMTNEHQHAQEGLARLDAAIFAARPPDAGEDWDRLEADFERLRTDIAVDVQLEQSVIFPRAVAAEEALLERRVHDAPPTRR